MKPLISTILTVFLGCMAAGQAVMTPETKLEPLRFPPQLRANIKALGDRFQKPGSERAVLVGTVADGRGRSSIIVTHELPGKVRIDRGGGRSLGFDGASNWASDNKVSEQDEDLLEALLEDSPEGMFTRLSAGFALRLLGIHMRMDDGKAAQYAGPWADVYQVVGKIPSRSSQPIRQKHYYFDSHTHLLSEVTYIVKGTTGVQLKRSVWTNVAGQMIPTSIIRVENGQAVLTVQIASVSFGPPVADNIFSPGH